MQCGVEEIRRSEEGFEKTRGMIIVVGCKGAACRPCIVGGIRWWWCVCVMLDVTVFSNTLSP